MPVGSAAPVDGQEAGARVGPRVLTHPEVVQTKPWVALQA